MILGYIHKSKIRAIDVPQKVQEDIIDDYKSRRDYARRQRFISDIVYGDKVLVIKGFYKGQRASIVRTSVYSLDIQLASGETVLVSVEHVRLTTPHVKAKAKAKV